MTLDRQRFHLLLFLETYQPPESPTYPTHIDTFGIYN
jgi:hypothetical protein